ncbi:MAG: hypothetical protein ACTHNW_03120 [Mucilaginibacter sp.]
MYWLLVIRLNIYNVEDNFGAIMAESAFPWLPLLLWQRKRLKLLKLNNSGRKDPITGILLVNWIVIMIPVFIAQSYMSTAIGKVTDLVILGQIKNYEPTKYYTVEHYYINKNYLHVKTTFTISGKGNANYNMNVYECIPIFDRLFPDTNRVAAIRNSVDQRVLVFINKKISSMDSLKKMPADSISYMKYYPYLNKFGNAGKYGALVVYTKSYKFKKPLPLIKISPSGWLAIEHSKTISNSLSLEEKQSAFKAFIRYLSLAYIKTNFNGFKYLSRLPNTAISMNFTMAVTSRGDVTDYDPVILTPHYDRFEDRNGNKLPWFFGALLIGWTVSLIILLCIPLKTTLPAKSTEA